MKKTPSPAAPHPFDFFSRLVWLDGRPLMDTIEPYRRELFERALYSFGADGWPLYDRVLSGRGKKNFKTADLTLAGLYRFFAWPSQQGNDGFIIANDEEQAGDDLSLAKKLIAVNPDLATEVDVLAKEIVRKDGAGRMKILPAQDVAGLHGKTYLFLGFDEIHGYRTYDLFEALSPDPTRHDCLTWITSYAGIRHAPGIPLYDMFQSGKAATDPRMLFSWYGGDFTTDAALAGEDVTPEQRANPSMVSWGDEGKYLESQKRRLPQHKYRRLHLNLPGAPDGAAFSAEAVIDAIVPGRKQLPPQEGVEYGPFVDMSGGSSDDAVLCIAHAEDGRVVIDVLVSQNGAPPFNPRHAVKKFAEILREYGLHRVTGDKFAGETFIADFAEEGIRYDVAELNRSQLYEVLEPRLNAGGIEFPNIGKLQEQALSLVVKASGKIDHLGGEHDDWINAAAGAAWLVATDTAPTLIRRADVALPPDAPIPPFGSISAVFWMTLAGRWATVFYAQPPVGDGLFIIDSLVGRFDVRTFGVITDRFYALFRDTHSRVRWLPHALLYTPDELRGLAWNRMEETFGRYLGEAAMTARFIGVSEIPKGVLDDPASLVLQAASYIHAGKVKLTKEAEAQTATTPLLGSLAIRHGEKIDDDPLRMAALLAIVLGLGTR